MRSSGRDAPQMDAAEVVESLFDRAARAMEESIRLRDEVQRCLARATLQCARLIRSSEGLPSPSPVSELPGYRALRLPMARPAPAPAGLG